MAMPPGSADTFPSDLRSSRCGLPSNRYQVSTPALILDLDQLDKNIDQMAAKVRVAGAALRPHAKTHKSPDIAHRQVAAGAVGIACATLLEADAMVAAGIEDVLITSPIAGGTSMRRLAELAAKAPALAVVVDGSESVAEIASSLRGTGAALDVLIELDIGHGRTGVQSAEAAVALARMVMETGLLRFRGVQAFAGHLQHVAAPSERRRRNDAASAYLREVCAALVAANLAPAIVSGSGTGTFDADAGGGVYTEIQAGSYVFMDTDYGQVEPVATMFPPALFVQATVVSANRVGDVVVDAGTKAFATNGPPPRVSDGALRNALYQFMGDEHGRLSVGEDCTLRVGDRVEFITSHCDPTVNLYGRYHCVQGDRVVDMWPVEARR